MEGFDIGQSLQDGVTQIFEYLPQLIGALVILVAGYFIAKFLQKITHKVLNRMKFDEVLEKSPVSSHIEQIFVSPSRFSGKVVFWVVWIGFISLAVSALNLEALNDFVAAVYGYLPNIIAAVIIFLVASLVSGGAVAFVKRVMGETMTAKAVITVVPAVTMSIAVFMILNQLGIAPEIVNITYTAIMGALALALALSFGLGGRDVAARILEQAYEAGLRNKAQVKRDLQRAKENTKKEAKKIRE